MAAARIGGIVDAYQYSLFQFRQNHHRIRLESLALRWYLIISVEKYKKISEILYLIAGWTIAPAIIPFYRVVGFSGILYLVLGGILYTVGVIFYKLEKKMYFHTIWHFFVLAGTAMHFILVYFYCF